MKKQLCSLPGMLWALAALFALTLIAQNSPAQQVLKGHTDNVLSVAYSPDGQTLASASRDKTIRIWSAYTGAHLRTLQGHTQWVLSVAYSPDSQTIASGGYDGTIRIWNANTGAHIQTLQGEMDHVWSVAYSPDGQTIASGGGADNVFRIDHGIQLWNANTGAHIRTLHGHTDNVWLFGWVWSVAYSPNGQMFASGSDDETIRIWNANTGEHLRTLQGHTHWVYSVAYSPDGQTIASGSIDKTVRLWNANTGEHLRTLQGHTASVYSVAYSPDGQTIASGCLDNTVRIWNANTGEHLQTFQGHTERVVSLAYSPDGQTLASGGDKTIRIQDVGYPPTATVSGPSGTQSGAFEVTIEFSVPVIDFESSDIVVTNGSATNLAGSGASYTATIEPTSDNKVTVSIPAGAVHNRGGKSNKASSVYETIINRQVLKGHERTVLSMAYSPDSLTLASGCDDTRIRIWDVNTGKNIRTLKGHMDWVRSVAYSPDSQTIVSGSDDRAIRIWNANTGENIRTLKGHTDWVRSVAYSPDGQTIVSGSGDRAIRIWNANTGENIRTLKGHTDWVNSVAYSPDSQTIVSGSNDRAIRIWNANTGENIRTLKGHTDSINSVAYSSDGQTIASGSADKTIRIWNANTGENIRTLQGHTDTVNSVAYSSDGQTIASGGKDKTIRIWNVNTGENIRTLQGHTDTVNSVAYSSDGQTIASGGKDKTIRIWGVSRPTITVSGPSGTQTGAFDVTIAFSAAVTGFTLSDIVVINGSAANLAGSGAAYTATIEPTSGNKVTVSIPAGGAQDAAGNISLASNVYSVEIARSTSFTVELRKGLNMLHVPVNDPRVERMSDLYGVLGGSSDVQFILAYSSELSRFISYVEGFAGAGSDLPLSNETAVLASMKNAKSVTFTGGLLKREVSLRAGINMIGFTRAGAVETVGGLAALSTVPLRVIALRLDKDGNALFADATDSTDAAKGGEGYFILAQDETVLTFDGSAWQNDPASAAAPVDAVAYDPSATPLLVVEGSVARGDNLAPLNGLEVSVTNLQTGQKASGRAGRGSVSGGFSLPLLALGGDSYAVGDAFDLRVSDSSGAFGGVQTVRIVLDKESVSTGRMDIGQLLAAAVPTKSALLPNYPNPFNPETWIPFDLSEAGRVTVTIYNAAGQTVRVLELGQLPPGSYRSRLKAAHWDGRNALGEPVASGIYYVRIEAGSFTDLRRMVVLK